VVLVHDDVSGAQVRERAQRSAARWAGDGTGCVLGAAAAQQTMLGEHGELQLRRDEALA
jgi:hypothetical protein